MDTELALQGRLLIELQTLDTEIIATERKLQELPQKQAILDVRHRRAELEGKAAKIAQALKARAQEEQRLATAIEQLESKIASEESKIAGTAAYKEVEQLTKDMQSLNKQRSELEDKELQLMDDDDKLNAAAAQAASMIAQSTADEERLIAEYREQGTRLQNGIVEMEHERDVHRESLGQLLLSRYDKQRAGHNGTGAATIKDGHCSACGVTLTDSQISKLLHASEIGLCPHCHRLMVVQP